MVDFGTRFGELVFKKREQLGWSLAQLAVAAYGDDGQGGESRKSDVQKLEIGRSRKPNAATVLRFKRALGLSSVEIDNCRSAQEIDLAKFADQLFSTLGEAATAIGVSEYLLAAMAERYAEGNSSNFSNALSELMRAIGVAAARRDNRETNGYIDTIMREVELLNDVGQIEAASKVLASEIGQKETQIEEHFGEYLEILQQGINQAIICRNPKRAAELAEKVVGAERLEPESNFLSLRNEAISWGARARDKGLSFDTQVALVLTKRCVEISQTIEQTVAAVHDCALVFRMMGERSLDQEGLQHSINLLQWLSETIPKETDAANWAKVQLDLAGAFGRLGERFEDTERLVQSILHHQCALEVFNKHQFLEQWFDTKTSLGSTQYHIGEREAEGAWLDEAIDSLSSAIEFGRGEVDQTDLGAALINLGAAHGLLGRRKADTVQLEAALKCYEEASLCFPKDEYSVEWAKCQSNLATTLILLADFEVGVDRLEAAAAVFRTVLEIRKREELPIAWAITNLNLSTCMAGVFERTGKKSSLVTACSMAVSALEVFVNAGSSYHIELTKKAIKKLDRLRSL